MAFVFIVIVVFVIFLAMNCVKVVPDGNAFVVERLGRYFRTLMPGTHVLAPFVDRVAHRYSLHPREEEIADTCITRDNVPVRIASVVRAQILDPRRAAYGAANAGDAVVTLVRSRQRLWIAERAWDDVRESTRELEVAVVAAAAEPANEIGIHVASVEVRSVDRVESEAR